MRVFYRLLTSNPTTLEDWMSYHAQGKEPPAAMRGDQDFMHRWEGLSVFDTYEAARNLAATRRWKQWKYIGVLHIPDDAPIIFEGPRISGIGTCTMLIRSF